MASLSTNATLPSLANMIATPTEATMATATSLICKSYSDYMPGQLILVIVLVVVFAVAFLVLFAYHCGQLGILYSTRTMSKEEMCAYIREKQMEFLPKELQKEFTW